MLIDAKQPLRAAKTAPISWSQRLGYLLEVVDATAAAESLKAYVRKVPKDMTPLLPSTPHANARAGKKSGGSIGGGPDVMFGSVAMPVAGL